MGIKNYNLYTSVSSVAVYYTNTHQGTLWISQLFRNALLNLRGFSILTVQNLVDKSVFTPQY